MTASYLPGMGSLSTLSEWIESNESLISSHLLVNTQEHAAGTAVCAAFLSRSGDGSFQLRLCEGMNDEFLIWRDQRRVRPLMGRSYAEATFETWLALRERDGYRSTWSARLQDDAPSALLAQAA